MQTNKKSLALWLAVFTAGCSGVGTTMTKVGRLTNNRGYEIAAELPVVQKAAMEVLKARGYETSVKADPENGPEGAGQIVIGQRVVKYSAQPGSAAGGETPKQMDTRDLVNVYLAKKWQVKSSLGVPNVTLVDIVGGSYLRRSASGEEEETPLTKPYVSLLRDEIERNVAAASAIKAAVPTPVPAR
jgi:hypothetical protein